MQELDDESCGLKLKTVWNSFDDNNNYLLKYIACFLMNFGTLCFIFEGWNILLNNEFRMYGPRVIYYLIYKTDLNGNIIEQNPMDSVFPKNSDCN